MLVFDRQERSHHPSPIQAFPFCVDAHPYHSMLHKGQNPEKFKYLLVVQIVRNYLEVSLFYFTVKTRGPPGTKNLKGEKDWYALKTIKTVLISN